MPDQVATGTRKLRCARCATEWTPIPPTPEAPPPSVPVPQMPPVAMLRPAPPPDPPRADAARPPPITASQPLTDVRAERPRRSGSRGAVAAAWIASLLILGGLGVAAYRFRDTVRQVWPPSQRVYAALGID